MLKSLVFALCMGGLIPSAGLASAPAKQQVSADAGEASVALVRQFLSDIRASMAMGDASRLRSVAERYMDAGYIQHSNNFGQGREGYIAAMTRMMASPPGPGGVGEDLYFVGNPQFVTWMSEVSRPDGSKQYMFNMFRIEGGKLKEHWGSQ